jgi:hypothetical protein
MGDQTMPVTHVPDSCKPVAARSPFAEVIAALMLATLMLAAFISLAALVPGVSTIAGDGASSVRIGELRQCAVLADNAARLSCFDDLADRPPPHPAKGANAPPAAFAPAR